MLCLFTSPSYRRYSLHNLRLPTEGWPGWVDLDCCLITETLCSISHLPTVTHVTHPSTDQSYQYKLDQNFRRKAAPLNTKQPMNETIISAVAAEFNQNQNTKPTISQQHTVTSVYTERKLATTGWMIDTTVNEWLTQVQQQNAADSINSLNSAARSTLDCIRDDSKHIYSTLSTTRELRAVP